MSFSIPRNRILSSLLLTGTLAASFVALSGCGAQEDGDMATLDEARSQPAAGGNSRSAVVPDSRIAYSLEDQGGSTCNFKQLDICLRYNGGEPCYPKWGCKVGEVSPSPEPSPEPSAGTGFSTVYSNQYEQIKAQVDEFYRGSFRCAAFASTALKYAGFKVTQKLVTNDVESQLVALGWRKVTDMGALKAGDVVFTDKATSNIPNTWSHVYVFHRYAEDGFAIISDNNGNNILRNIGPGRRSRSVLAYRAP